MLVEVDPVEVAEISRVGLLGWVDALAMKPRIGSSRPRRAWSSSGVQSSLIKIGQHCKEVYKGIVYVWRVLKGHTTLQQDGRSKSTAAPFF